MERTAPDRFAVAADAVLARYRARCKALAERAAALALIPDGPAKDAATLTAALELHRPAGAR